MPGKDVAKAVTLSDEEIARLSRESVEWMDANNPVAAIRRPTEHASSGSPKVSPTPTGYR